MTRDIAGIGALAASLALVFGLTSTSAAQTLGGTVVSVTTHLSTPAMLVTLQSGDSVVASTHTDSLGVFYLTPPKAGVYQVYFGDPEQGQFVVDSLVIGADEFVQRDFSIPPIPHTYREGDVERHARAIYDAHVLKYPDYMRHLRIEGAVIAQFIVDSTGHPRPGSLKIINSSDAHFSEAVREAFPNLRFEPASINGKKVAQLVQEPFTFTLSSAVVP